MARSAVVLEQRPSQTTTLGRNVEPTKAGPNAGFIKDCRPVSTSCTLDSATTRIEECHVAFGRAVLELLGNRLLARPIT